MVVCAYSQVAVQVPRAFHDASSGLIGCAGPSTMPQLARIAVYGALRTHGCTLAQPKLRVQQPLTQFRGHPHLLDLT